MRTQKGSAFPSLGEGLPEKVTFKLVPKDKVEWGWWGRKQLSRHREYNVGRLKDKRK